MTARNEDFLFAQEAEKLGYVSEQQVEEAFLLQKRMSEDLKIDERLAVILVKRGWIAEEQARRVYAIIEPKGASQQIEGYRLIAKIGRGAMGTVYKAIHERLNRTVAIKILRRDLATDKTQIERLKGEAQLLASLDHPNIVRAIDAGESNGFPYFVMEYVEGENLRDTIIREGPFDEDDALRITRDLANALERARRMGVVHRDVKPGNVILTRRGKIPKLMDLGLAKGPIDLGLTQHGATVGTPQFISPEQAQDPRQADTRSDIYSLGATLYAMLTSRPPFEGATLAEIITKVLYEQPTPIRVRNDDVSPEVSYLVERMMLKDPSLRYRTPADVAEDIDRISGGRSIVPQGFTGNWEAFLLRRRMKRWARRGLLAGVALVLLSVGAFFFLRAQSRKEHLAEIVKLESQALDARYPDLEAPFSPWLATETLAHNLDSLRKQSQTRAAGAQRAYATARDRRDTISTHERLADTEGPQHDEVEAHVARLEQLAADYSALAKLAKATLDKIAGKGKPDFAGARAAVDTMRDTRGLLATSPVDDALERVRRKLGDASTAALPATLELASSLSRRPSSLEDFETAWTTCRDDLTSGRFVATAAATEATETVQALCRSIAQIREDLEAVEGEFAPDAIAPRLERHEIDAIFEAWVQRRSGLVRDIQARLKPYSERPYALTPASLLGEGRPVATRLDDVRVRLESAVRALVARLIARVERESGNTAFDPDSVEEIRQAVTSLRKATRIRFQDEEKSLEDALQRLLASHGAYVESVRAFYEDTRRLLFEVLTSGDTREFTRLLDERIAEREKRQWGPDARFEALRAAGAVLADLQARALRTLAQRLADGRVKFERVRLRDRVDARWKLLAVDRELGTIDVEVRGRGSQRRTELVRIAQVHPEQLLAWVRNPAPALRAVAALSAMEPVDDEPGLDLRPAVAAWQATHEAFGALEGEQAERLALWVAYAKTWHADLDGYQQRREEGASAAERAADAFRGALQWVAAHEELKRLYDGEGRLRYTDVFDERRSFLDKLYSEVRAMLERNKLLLFFPGAGVVPKEDGETEITLNFDAPIQKKNILHGFGVLERQPTSKQSTPKEPTAKLQLHLLKGETSLRRDRPLAFDQPFDPAKRITFEMNIHTLAGSYLLAFDIDGVKVAVSSADPRIFDRRFDENTPLLEDESRLPEFDFYAMGRGVAFHVAPTRNFGSMFPYEGWNWPRAGRGRNFKAWQDKRKLRDPGNRLFAFDRGTAYRVRVVREKDKMRLFVDDVLVAAMQRKEWADIGTRSDIDRNMRHGSGRIQLLTWTPLIVDDVVLTGTLSERWKLDQKARLEAEAKKREEAARGEGERK